MNIIGFLMIIKLTLRRRRSERKKFYYYYEKVYYNDDEIMVSVNGIKSENIVRSYNYMDESGSGYVYRIIENDKGEVEVEMEGEKSEFMIEGRCECCFECMEDDNCEKDDDEKMMFCVDNYCVECKNDDDCEKDDDDDDEGMMMCHKGKCIIGECKDNTECKSNEICQNDGYCVEGCRNDDECDKNTICNDVGKCVKGCRSDNECSEICLEGECSSGCRDNFDCSNYDNVCINDQCVSTEDSMFCLDENECTDMDYYCDYEYMICVKKKETSIDISRRNIEVVPALSVCALYGIISLFILATSYTVASKLSNDALNDACEQRCSNMYLSSKKKVVNVKVKGVSDKTQSKTRKPKFSDSECTGKCQARKVLIGEGMKGVEGINVEESLESLIFFSENYCPQQSLTQIITGDERLKIFEKLQMDGKGKYKNQRISSSGSYEVFRKFLTQFCKSIKYQYSYPYVKTYPGTDYPPKKYFLKRERVPCGVDLTSIKCKEIISDKPKDFSIIKIK